MKNIYYNTHIYTPEIVTKLKPNEIFVFGSNLAGIHGAGAALYAKKHFGAKEGVGYGFTGKCFALPTKDHLLNPLTLDIISSYIFRLFCIAEAIPDNIRMLVTKIGTGLAEYTIEEIANLFYIYDETEKIGIISDNVEKVGKTLVLPKEFIEYMLNNEQKLDW